MGVICDDFKEAYVKATSTIAGDDFGYAVSLSGDTLAVGALDEGSCATGPGANPGQLGCSGAGAAYIFRRDAAGAWHQEAYIKPSHIAADDRFGRSLSLDGDTLAVAAAQEDHCAEVPEGTIFQRCEDAGAVFIFRRGGADGNVTWEQEGYLKASNVEAGDQFGWAVAVAGETVAVSSILEQSCATGVDGDQTNNDCHKAGAVYVFRRSMNGASPAWLQEAYIKASNTDAIDEYDYFGRALALDADTLVVGADGEDSCADPASHSQTGGGCADSGATYVFRRNESPGTPTWTQEALLKASVSRPGAGFGSAVALFGDSLAIGAPREASCATSVDGDQQDQSCPEAGAAYVFERSQEGGQVSWQQSAYLKASNTDTKTNSFGSALSLGLRQLAVGAPLEDSCAIDVDGNANDNACKDAGAVYLFERSPEGGWSQQAYLKASHPDGAPPGDFGRTVSLSGTSLAIGAPLEDGCATKINGAESKLNCAFAGAVYVRRVAP